LNINPYRVVSINLLFGLFILGAMANSKYWGKSCFYPMFG